MKLLPIPTIQRLQAAREKIAASGLDALLVSSRENTRYLSGFSGTESWLVITAGQAFILIDFRYWEQAAMQCPDFERVNYTQDRTGSLVETLRAANCKVLGVEGDDLSWGLGRQLSALMPATELKLADSWLNDLRSVKDETEVAMIRHAVEIAETALQEILPSIRAGQSEVEIAARLENAMRSQGASGPSFATIIASGPRSALPHGVASERLVQAGDAIVMDFGCIWQGYCSDMTRTVFLGEPGELARKIYQIVLEAQVRSAAALMAGMTGGEADAAARTIISGAGYGPAFGHSLGHGVGLAIHESPRLMPNSSLQLLAGQIVSVEPGIYLPGQLGVRIEDLMLIEDGGALNLNTFNKELIILPA
jgi:Xaa-Pro aminopeptidase